MGLPLPEFPWKIWEHLHRFQIHDSTRPHFQTQQRHYEGGTIRDILKLRPKHIPRLTLQGLDMNQVNLGLWPSEILTYGKFYASKLTIRRISDQKWFEVSTGRSTIFHFVSRNPLPERVLYFSVRESKIKGSLFQGIEGSNTKRFNGIIRLLKLDRKSLAASLAIGIEWYPRQSDY